MNRRLISVLIFALLVSAVASMLIYRLIVARVTANAHAPTTSVIVAARDLGVGALIRDIDLKVVESAGPVPAQTLGQKEEIVGRGVVAPIYEGEPILASRLAPKGAGAGLAAMIPKGKRAVAVRVNEVVGVAGFVVPGMRVDVLISGTPPGGSQAAQGTQTKTVLQNIEVLSAGQNLQKDAEGKPVSVTVVNLLVTPEEAETLSLASDTRIQLVLRNPLDQDQSKTPGTTMATLFSGHPAPVAKPALAPKPKPRPAVVARIEPPPAAAVPPPAVKVTVEVIHGAKRTESQFTKKSEEKP